MEPFDITSNITEPLFKSILNTIKEMFYLTKLMYKDLFSEIDSFSAGSILEYTLFARLSAMFRYLRLTPDLASWKARVPRNSLLESLTYSNKRSKIFLYEI